MQSMTLGFDVIDVTINKDGSLTVQDHGRGMPTENARYGIQTVEGYNFISFMLGKIRTRWLQDLWWSPWGLDLLSSMPFLVGLK